MEMTPKYLYFLTVKSQEKALSYLSLGPFSVSFVGTEELKLASLDGPYFL